MLMQTGHLCGRVLQHQVSDAGLHGDVGSDQQLQRTDRRIVLKAGGWKTNDEERSFTTHSVTFCKIIDKHKTRIRANKSAKIDPVFLRCPRGALKP